MAVVYFARYRVADAAGRARQRLAALRECGTAVRRAYRVRLDDGQWLDVIVCDGDLPEPLGAFYGSVEELLGEETGTITDGDLFEP